MARNFLPVGYFRHTANVYTLGAVTTEPDVLDREALPCLIESAVAAGADTGPERAFLANERRVTWAPDYVLPDDAQFEFDRGDGQAMARWNPQPPTPFLRTHRSGDPLFYEARVVRAA